MSLNRYAQRTDASQAELVKDLRKAGIDVWIIYQPCDLLLRFYCERHRDFCWQPLEVKTPYGKKDPKARVDARQEKQQEFLRETLTPIATDFESAWRQLNMRHSLNRPAPLDDLLPFVEPRLFRNP